MSHAEIRGVIQGRTVVLNDAAGSLPDGTEVIVTPVAPVTPRRGDPEALFAALDELPPMSDEDAATILRVINEDRKIDYDSWR
jgi:hypothetical protein